MRLMLCVAHIEKEAIPKSIKIYMKQFTSTIKPLLTGNNNSFTVDLQQGKRISHIALCFINKSNELFHASSCDFTGGFTSPTPATSETYINTNQINNLYQVYINFAGAKYPAYESVLCSSDGKSTVDLARAWYDTLLASDQLRDRCGSTIDFKTFLASPIFIWKTRQDIKWQSNTLNVTVNCKSATGLSYSSNINCFIMGLYDECYSLTFDNEYRVLTENLQSVALGEDKTIGILCKLFLMLKT